MPLGSGSINFSGENISEAVAQSIKDMRPEQPYAGVAIGDAIDSGLMWKIQNDDPAGEDQLFNSVIDPHLGANLNAMA